MRSNRLRTQILLLTILLIAAVSATVLSTVWFSTAKYAQKQVADDVSRAVTVFNQLLNDRQDQLIASAEVLTADFGFKQAVASNDSATIASVLENHAARIDADLMLLIGLDGTINATSDPADNLTGSRFEPPELLEDAIAQGGTASFVVREGKLFQIIMLPVRAPVPVAMAGIGFELDQELAEQLFRLTSLHVSFLDQTDEQRTVLISTLPEAVRETALDAESDISSRLRLPFLQAQSFASTRQAMTEYEDHRIEAVLSVDLNTIFADFDELRDRVFIISLMTILLAIVGSAALSRNLAGPLQELEKIARQIAHGQYHHLPAVRTRTLEIKALFTAFIAMRNEIKSREQRIRHQATHDHLTGLLNRLSLLERTDHLIANSREPFVVASININGFRGVNDTFGPKIGDQCLKAVGARLRDLADEPSLVARSGADEFFLILPVPTGASPYVLGPRILEEMCQPLEFERLKLSLSFSIGVAIYPNDGSNADKLIRRAGIALDQARTQRVGICYYQEGEEEAHLDRLALLEDLKQALRSDDGQLRMVYQPKLNLVSGGIDKCEALIRWIHPTRNFVSPEMFVALAENSGLIDELTDWVVKTVIHQVAQWRTHGLSLQVSINISAQDLERDNLLDQVQQLLDSHGLPPSVLSFELTERDMMNDAEKAVNLMGKFRLQGFHLSVDDYGIGQSSLSKLKQMPVSELKIDKSFVLQLDQSESDQIIVQSTIDLGHRFRLKVIAEGVETRESLDLLASMGCDYIQGYYLARPMPPADFLDWMREREQNNGDIKATPAK